MARKVTHKKLSAMDKMRRGIITLLRTDPFYASILSGHKLVQLPPTEGILIEDGPHKGETAYWPTACINGRELLFNPCFIDSLTEDEIDWLLVHEALHICFGHHVRLFTRWPHIVCNAGADLAINSLIRGRRGEIKQCLRPGREEFLGVDLRGWADDLPAETYCKRFSDEMPPPPPGGGEGEEGEGQEQGEGQGNGSGMDTPQYDMPGECAPHPDLVEASKEGDAQEMQETSNRLQQEWKTEVSKAITQAKQAGNAPGFIKELSDQLFGQSEIPWQVKLRKYCAKRVKRGRSFRRPNRRWMWQDEVVSPVRDGRGLGNLVMVVDYSGSHTYKSRKAGLREVAEIVKCYPETKVTVILFDTSVTNEPKKDTFSAHDFNKWAKNFEFKGGGGTHFRPPLQEVRKCERPDVCLFLTDGWSSDGWGEDIKLPCRVGWLMTTDEKPPYGEVIKVKVDNDKN